MCERGSRLQLDKLLDHVFIIGHLAAMKTKIVFQANGIPPCDESMNLIITGVPSSAFFFSFNVVVVVLRLRFLRWAAYAALVAPAFSIILLQ